MGARGAHWCLTCSPSLGQPALNQPGRLTRWDSGLWLRRGLPLSGVRVMIITPSAIGLIVRLGVVIAGLNGPVPASRSAAHLLFGGFYSI